MGPQLAKLPPDLPEPRSEPSEGLGLLRIQAVGLVNLDAPSQGSRQSIMSR